MSKTPTIDEVRKLLQSHDWSYEYSDDGDVWRRGRASADRCRIALHSLPDIERKQLEQEFAEQLKRYPI